MMEYLFAAVIFVVLDGIYINLIKGAFSKQIKNVQGSDMQINIIAAAITYIILIFGLIYFILRRNRSVHDAAIFGFVIYGVYDFTNMATLKNWSLILAIIDTCWGAILFGLTTAIIYKLENFFPK